MTIVKIPFRPAFREPLLSGVKRCTARTKRMGAGGDRFLAFDQWFDLKIVTEAPLHYVADLWRQEGCTSREHFIEVWESMHPSRGYQPEQIVFLHWFKLVRS